MNSNNNGNIYYKLKDELINSLESEEFYEVFNRSIKSGTNNFSLYQKFMNNIIDVKWVKAIEECIIPIDNIIRNPMRFIKQEEEIVPIEQAKKISQESIRHLAQHTNMISKVDYDGSVTPNKILNIHLLIIFRLLDLMLIPLTLMSLFLALLSYSCNNILV